jgi:DNA repair exonuclease SbcCD ATPase subunit
MAIDEIPDTRRVAVSSESHSHALAFAGIFAVIALLAIGEVSTSRKLDSLRASLEAENAQAQKQLVSQINDQISGKLAALENANTRQLEELKTELDAAAQRMGSTGKELRRARTMVAQLQNQQDQQEEQLREQIGRKADQAQINSLSQDVTATKSDLDNTKKTVGVLTSDLGMARSELGTLIARNHDDIEALRKLGQRNYYEFTLTRGESQKIAGVGLMLKKTNVKHHSFNLNLLTDDMEVEKNNRTVNEPIFFSVGAAKGFYELVVNTVAQNTVAGYISTPKYSTEVATKTEGEK